MILLHRKMRISLLKNNFKRHIWMLENQYASFHVFTLQGNKTDIRSQTQICLSTSFFYMICYRSSTAPLCQLVPKTTSTIASKNLWQQTMVTGNLMGGNQNSYYQLVTDIGHTICKRNSKEPTMTNLTVFKTANTKMQSIRSPSGPNPKSKTPSTIEIETNTYLTNSSS